MTPTAESQSQRLLDTFTTAVNGVSDTVPLAEAVQKSVQEGCAALVNQVRASIQLRSFALRGLLMVEIKLHQLRSLAETDPRIRLLRGLQNDLQAHATVSSTRSVVESPMHGYGSAFHDAFARGVPEARQTEARMTAGVGAVSAVTGVAAFVQAMRSRGARFWGWLTASMASLGVFFTTGAIGSVRAATGRPGSPEGESRTFALEAPGSTMVTSGLTLSRLAGGNVVIRQGANQYSIVLPGMAASAGRPAAPEVSISGMMPRVFTSPSTGTGIGIEAPRLGSGVSLAMPDAFRIAGTGMDAMRTALSAGPVPATGVEVTIPLSFRTQYITPEQVAFIRRCIAGGATMDANSDWLTVNTPVRLMPLAVVPSVPSSTPPALGTPERAVNDLGAAAAQSAMDGIAAVTDANLAATAGNPATHATIQAHLKVLHDIIDAVPVANRNAAMTAAATALLGRPALTARGNFVIQGGTRFTLGFDAATWRFTFRPAVAPSAFPDVLRDLNAQGRKGMDELARTLEAIDGGTGFTGNPGLHASITPKVNALNALIPVAARADAAVIAAAQALLGIPTADPMSGRSYVVAGTTYRFRFNTTSGQFEFYS